MNKKSLIIACDGEAASGKSTGAKLISKKYNLKLINSGLFYRYASKIILEKNPKNFTSYLNKKFKKIDYNKIKKEDIFTQKVSNYVGILAKKKKVREIIDKKLRKIIKKEKRVCIEGRDIASNILSTNPKYDVAFYFRCNLNISSKRRWIDLKKKVSLKEVRDTLKNRTLLDKKRKFSPLIKVKDAHIIETSKLSKNAVLKKMSNIIDNKIK